MQIVLLYVLLFFFPFKVWRTKICIWCKGSSLRTHSKRRKGRGAEGVKGHSLKTPRFVQSTFKLWNWWSRSWLWSQLWLQSIWTFLNLFFLNLVRIWTLPLEKLGPIGKWQSIIADANFKSSPQKALCLMFWAGTVATFIPSIHHPLHSSLCCFFRQGLDTGLLLTYSTSPKLHKSIKIGSRDCREAIGDMVYSEPEATWCLCT